MKKKERASFARRAALLERRVRALESVAGSLYSDLREAIGDQDVSPGWQGKASSAWRTLMASASALADLAREMKRHESEEEADRVNRQVERIADLERTAEGDGYEALTARNALERLRGS